MDARITFAPNTTTDQLASRLDQPHILDPTPHPTIRDMSNAASTSSLLDYRSPTIGSITPPPDEVADDPWSATVEKLDNTLKGTKLVVERPPPDDDVVPDVSSSLNGLTSASSIAERAARRAASEAPSESPEWMKDLERIKVPCLLHIVNKSINDMIGSRSKCCYSYTGYHRTRKSWNTNVQTCKLHSGITGAKIARNAFRVLTVLT